MEENYLRKDLTLIIILFIVFTGLLILVYYIDLQTNFLALLASKLYNGLVG